MAEKCCDTQTMNCEKLIGVGPMFSTNDTLNFKLQLLSNQNIVYNNFFLDLEINYKIIWKFLYQQKVNEINSFEDVAKVIDSKKFEIKYPFGFFKNIILSNVTLKVGISYGISDYSYRTVSFYDSSCMTCTNGIVDPKPVKIF